MYILKILSTPMVEIGTHVLNRQLYNSYTFQTPTSDRYSPRFGPERKKTLPEFDSSPQANNCSTMKK